MKSADVIDLLQNPLQIICKDYKKLRQRYGSKIIMNNEQIKKELASSNKKPILSIIIVNYNVKEYILNCIQSIQDKIDAKRIPFEVIVSDNGSVDESVQTVRKNFPWVRVIENNANIGFSKGNNIGATQAEGQVLFFLNPDTIIVNGIEDICDYIVSHKEVGGIYPLVLDRNNRVVYLPHLPLCIMPFYWLIYPIFLTPLARFLIIFRKFIYNKHIKQKTVLNANSFDGSALLLRKEVFEKIGMFDEQIFMYFEEFDISKRLKKYKYKIQMFPKANLIHFGGTSSQHGHSLRSKILFIQSMKTVLKKHYKRSWYVRYYLEAFLYIKEASVTYVKVIINFFARKDNKSNLLYIRYCLKYVQTMQQVIKGKAEF